MKNIALSVIFMFLAGCATLMRMVDPNYGAPDHRDEWKTVTADSGKKYDLVRYRVAELGLKQPASLREVNAAAEKSGLELTPEEAAIPLRLQYYDQPEGEALFLGMNEVSEGFKGPTVYVVRRIGDKRVMDAVLVGKASPFALQTEFVFVRKKSPAR